MALEPVFHAFQPRGLLRRDLGGRDTRPQLNHRCKQLLVDRGGGLAQQFVQPSLNLQQPLAAGRDAGIGVLLLVARARLRQQVKLGLQAFHLGLQCRDFGQLRGIQIKPRAGFIDQVDGLVGQEAVGDIALAHLGGAAADVIRHLYAVEGLVVRADAFEDFGRLRNRRLADVHRLEAALKRGILFDVLAVFLERGRADHLNIAAGKRGFQDIRGVHRAFRVARADDVVHLVDDKDDIAEFFHLVNQALHTAFKLAAKLRARDKCGQVEQVHLFVAHLERDTPLVDAHSQPLRDRRLTDTRLADQAGVVLLAAV